MTDRRSELLSAASDSALVSRVLLPDSVLGGFMDTHDSLPGISAMSVCNHQGGVYGPTTLDFEFIREESEVFRDDLVRVRRHLHKNPETAFKEFKTAKLVKEHLEKIDGVSFIRTGVAMTGVVCSVIGTLDEDVAKLAVSPCPWPTPEGTAARKEDKQKPPPPVDKVSSGKVSPIGSPLLDRASSRRPFSAGRPSPPSPTGPSAPSQASISNRLSSPLLPPQVQQVERPVVLVRGDMDALAMADGLPESCPYRSAVPGVAHKCGHDVHVATLMYAVNIVAARRHLFRGEVRFVFQPAEETTGGARPMIQEGVADGIHAGLSLHVMTWNEVGTVAVRDGMINASEDSIYVRVIGDGGHAAEPWLASNPIVAACSMVSATHSWLAKTVEATKAVVLTISSIESGTAAAVNVIPETCSFTATLRCLDERARTDVVRNLPAMWEALASAFECRTEVEIVRGYTSGRNDPLVTNAVRRCVTRMYGADALIEIPDPEMGSEDFFEFGQQGKVPVCQLWLGGANEDRGITTNNHCPDFDVDEDCLPMGTAVIAATALDLIHTLGGTGLADATKRKVRHRRGPAHVPHIMTRPTNMGRGGSSFANGAAQFSPQAYASRRITSRGLVSGPISPTSVSPVFDSVPRHLISAHVAAALSDGASEDRL